jgi:uncharacterized protein (UPF0276 family)
VTQLGFTLQPEERMLALLAAVIREEPDYYEIAPETLWRRDGAGGFLPNGFHALFAALAAETGKPFVAHGVGMSLGTVRPDASDMARRLARVAADHATFQFQWYTDHLGATVLDGMELTLPMPPLMTQESAMIVRKGLEAMRAIVPDVGVENSVFYFHLGDPLDEPAFLADVVRAPGCHLLLDLHNVYATAVNAGFEPWAYIERLPLDKVIEIHLAGGSESDPGWLASKRVLRLDSHDDSVPDEVWELFERVLPLCPNLRGVTLERMEGTVTGADVPLIRAELQRARRTMELARV